LKPHFKALYSYEGGNHFYSQTPLFFTTDSIIWTWAFCCDFEQKFTVNYFPW